jgi:hypothetical protein
MWVTSPIGKPVSDKENPSINEVDLREDAPPTATGTAVSIPDIEDISHDDSAFIRRVFETVKEVEFRAPPQPPSRGLTGPDAKLQKLRETIRRHERDLARVRYVWGIKDRRIQQVDGIIEQHRARQEQSDRRYDQIMEQAQRAAQESKARSAQLESRIDEQHHKEVDQLRAMDNLRQEHLAQVKELGKRIQNDTQKTEAYVSDVQQRMQDTADAFNKLRNQSADEILKLERQLRSTEERGHHEKEQHLKQVSQRKDEHQDSIQKLRVEFLGEKQNWDEEQKRERQEQGQVLLTHQEKATSERAALLANHNEALTQKDTDYREMETRHASERESLIASHATALAVKDKAYQAMEAKLQDTFEKLQHEHAQTDSSMQAQHHAERETLNAQHTKTLSEKDESYGALENQHRLEREALIAQHAEALAQKNEAHKEEEKQHHSSRERSQSSHARELLAKEKALADFREQHDTMLMSLRKDFDQERLRWEQEKESQQAGFEGEIRRIWAEHTHLLEDFEVRRASDGEQMAGALNEVAASMGQSQDMMRGQLEQSYEGFSQQLDKQRAEHLEVISQSNAHSEQIQQSLRQELQLQSDKHSSQEGELNQALKRQREKSENDREEFQRQAQQSVDTLQGRLDEQESRFLQELNRKDAEHARALGLVSNEAQQARKTLEAQLSQKAGNMMAGFDNHNAVTPSSRERRTSATHGEIGQDLAGSSQAKTRRSDTIAAPLDFDDTPVTGAKG